MDNIKLSMTIDILNDRDWHTEEFLVPMTALKTYLNTEEDSRVLEFLRTEYMNEDTESVIELCEELGLDIPIVPKQKRGYKTNKYKITNRNTGVSFIVTEEELFEIATHWVNECNEFEEMYHDENDEDWRDRLWHKPADMSDVEEILGEYMGCDIEKEIKDQYSTEDMFLSLSKN